MKRVSLLALGLLTFWSPCAFGEEAVVTWQSRDGGLVFSHALHVDSQAIECNTCHAGAESSRHANDRLLPAMEVCAGCHDVEDDGTCTMCHRDPEKLEAVPIAERPIVFGHENHMDRGATCMACHEGAPQGSKDSSIALPKMARCMNCHDGLRAGNDCQLCHEGRVTLAELHPPQWRHIHGDVVPFGDESCAGCHRDRSTCLECHKGDNLTGWTHDLNYQFTHGLDARSKEIQCDRCHETQSFCNGCHESLHRIPLNHSTLAWQSEHGGAARQDAERCQSCHDSADPTCARAGCHADTDGARGTDPSIHESDRGRFEQEGPWHEDAGYFCFQCHVSTGTEGLGFCGYCHGS